MPTLITTFCKHCGEPFEQQEHWHKDYCDVRCRDAAKRSRERKKTKARDEKNKEVVWNPTEEQLNAIATALTTGAVEGPKIFRGFVPMWEPPRGILWAKQADEKDMWGMGRE